MPHRTAPRHRRAITAATTAGAAMLLTAGTAYAELDPGQLQAVTDRYLFQTSLSDFGRLHVERPHDDQLDWSSDGCSYAPDEPLTYDFSDSCDRHDFGYRNYEAQARFSEQNRLRIDDNFKKDMYSGCRADAGCEAAANVYYWAVREFGDMSATDAVQQAAITPERSPSGEVTGYFAKDPNGHTVRFDA